MSDILVQTTTGEYISMRHIYIISAPNKFHPSYYVVTDDSKNSEFNITEETYRGLLNYFRKG